MLRRMPFAALLSLALALPAVAAPAGLEALGLGFRFASAIEGDAKDRARAQQAILEDMLAIGAADEAAKLAPQVDGWRRGVILAELAADAARAGRPEQARALIAKAQEVRGSVQGWENPRIAAHIADALAVLGEAEPIETISRQLLAEDDRQYLGRAARTQAVGSASRGDFDLGFAKLQALDGERDYEAALGRTQGYLDLARAVGASPEQRRRALTAARGSAAAIPGFKQTEMLQAVGERFQEIGDHAAAVEAIEAAQSGVLATAPRAPERAAVLATQGRAWGKIGEPARARELLEGAAAAVAYAQSIERPGILAFIAAGHLRIGDDTAAARLEERALVEAAALVNARPRALAAVEICRAIGLERAALRPGTRTRLEALLRGLKAPW
jgi:hypothetical protein